MPQKRQEREGGEGKGERGRRRGSIVMDNSLVVFRSENIAISPIFYIQYNLHLKLEEFHTSYLLSHVLFLLDLSFLFFFLSLFRIV